MIFLCVLGGLILIILGVLFIPVVVDLEYTDEFKFKVSFLKITLFKTTTLKPKNIEKIKTAPKESKPKQSVLNDAKKYFKIIKEKKGFTEAVKEVMELVGRLLSHIKRLLAHINICKVKLGVTVGTADAAKTAVDYGLVCSAIYPVTAELSSLSNVDFKEINVNADFEGQTCSFEFKGTVKMRIFYLLLCAFKIYSTLKKFITEKMENER